MVRHTLGKLQLFPQCYVVHVHERLIGFVISNAECVPLEYPDAYPEGSSHSTVV